MWAVFAFLCLGSALIGQEQFRAGRALEDFDIRADKINPAAQFFSTRALQRSTPHQISGMPDREIPSCGTADVSVFLCKRFPLDTRWRL